MDASPREAGLSEQEIRTRARPAASAGIAIARNLMDASFIGRRSLFVAQRSGVVKSQSMTHD